MKKAVVTLALLAALVVAAPANASVGLKAWWAFYEHAGTVAHDLSGNGNTGTLSGAAQWANGYFGSGLSFDGSTARVDVPDTASLEPANALTVTAWVKSAGTPGQFRYIVAKGATSCIAASYGLYTGANQGLQFYVSQNGGFSYAISPDAGTGVWDGNWHFVVGTYDGAAVHLYVDGSEIGTGTPETGPIGYNLPNGNDLFIGHYDGCTLHDFAGTIDEPTVSSGALTPSQISYAYKIMVGLHGFVSRLPAFPVN
jgi:Concanavalin A-like lectin/glucanases superfamily